MSETMKAVRLHAFGGPDVLRYEDAPRPTLAAGEVLVRVHAVGLNPPDWYLRDGYRSLPPEWQPHPAFPLILGSDVSGVVAALDDGVEGFSVGDEVYAMVRFPQTSWKAARPMPNMSACRHRTSRANRASTMFTRRLRPCRC